MTDEERGRDLIVCCDGTNNTLTGGARDTNVLLLVEALRRGARPNQVLYYDPGVGSPDDLPMTGFRQYFRRKWDRIAGLASGQGIFENIGEAYSFLIRHYRDGDRVWLFGFSRGAFAARSVAGMVSLFGIIKPEHRVLLPTLLRVYFARVAKRGKLWELVFRFLKRSQVKRRRDDVAGQVRKLFTSEGGGRASVHFVGVWDTVESVGMPGISLQISGTPVIAGKPIKHARHALSLDEHRWPFLPRVYEEKDFGQPSDSRPPVSGRIEPSEQSLRQAWFRGVHSDVGGGYFEDESGLSRAAFEWMVDEANLCGLGCSLVGGRPGGKPQRAVAHDPLYETPLWAVAGMTARDTRVLPEAPEAANPQGPPLGAVVTSSVWDRRRPLVPFACCAVGAVVSMLLSGWMLQPGPGSSSLLDFTVTPSLWRDAAVRSFDLACAQLGAWFRSPLELIVGVPGACPHRALLFDAAFVAFYAYLLARLCTRAFHRRAGARQVGHRAPKLRVLGAALPMLVFGDLLEDFFGFVGFSFGPSSALGAVSFGLGVIPSAVKLIGALGCAVLIGIGWVLPRRR